MRFGCPHAGITCDPDIAHRGVAAVDIELQRPVQSHRLDVPPVAVDADPPAQIVRREIGPVQLEGDGSLYPAQRRVHSIEVEVEIRLAAIDRGDLDPGLASEQAVTVHVDVSRRARVTSDLHWAPRHSARRWSINGGGPELKARGGSGSRPAPLELSTDSGLDPPATGSFPRERPPPRAAGSSPRKLLLHPQRRHGLHARGPTRRQPARQQADRDEQRRHAAEHGRVERSPASGDAAQSPGRRARTPTPSGRCPAGPTEAASEARHCATAVAASFATVPAATGHTVRELDAGRPQDAVIAKKAGPGWRTARA